MDAAAQCSAQLPSRFSLLRQKKKKKKKKERKKKKKKMAEPRSKHDLNRNPDASSFSIFLTIRGKGFGDMSTECCLVRELLRISLSRQALLKIF